ncbi:alpha/beta hydrolase [Ideonella sp. 4Y11]|uniref:Alpha/beta hydrolase n=1 Tax=Ideonella aquatica TaxID=2824119 RepID=A0A941BI66_9BURK|nr:alpha/beta hydrolase [Ideonella aquatica]MBQ0961646.1 alpha/beta hydrolase [Ideonella aquatica]
MNAFDPVWLDQQYNNRARIPEHAQLFERWRQASALARQQLNWRSDLAYGDAPTQTLDVFLAERRDAPVLIFIHGGYWRSLDKADHSFVAPAFVAAGAHVVVPNYSLCPSVGIADIALEMTRVVAWTVAHAGELGMDPARIALAGHSAGAHLAAMLLCCRWKDVDPALPPQPLAGALGISGLYDLEPLRHAPFIRDDLRLSERDAWRLSPAFYPRPRKPLYAVAGGDESEEFIRHNRLIRDQWGPSSVPVCETLARHHHLDILHNLADPAGRLHELALRLLGLR